MSEAKTSHPSPSSQKVNKELYGMSEKERMEFGMSWLKAHKEVDARDREIDPESYKREPWPPLGSIKSEAKSEKVDGRGDVQERIRKANVIDRQTNTREVWSDLLSPVGKRIARSNSESKSMLLNREERELIGVFLAAAENKMLEDSSLKLLVERVNAQAPEAPKPPDDPAVAPELTESWKKFELLRESIRFFQNQSINPETNLSAEETVWLGRFLRGVLNLFPSDPATIPPKPRPNS